MSDTHYVSFDIDLDFPFYGFHVNKHDSDYHTSRFYAWVTVQDVWDTLHCEHTCPGAIEALRRHLKAGGTLDGKIRWEKKGI
jgi:hypothetical protein